MLDSVGGRRGDHSTPAGGVRTREVEAGHGRVVDQGVGDELGGLGVQPVFAQHQAPDRPAALQEAAQRHQPVVPAARTDGNEDGLRSLACVCIGQGTRKGLHVPKTYGQRFGLV